MGFLVSFVKNDEIRPSISCQIILEWREERNQLNYWNVQLEICSSAFSTFNPYRPTVSLARGTYRQFYCTGVIIYNKLDNHSFISDDRQTFLGFEMKGNLRDTSPLNTTILFHFLSPNSRVTSSPISTNGAQYFKSRNCSDSRRDLTAWWRATLALFPSARCW